MIDNALAPQESMLATSISPPDYPMLGSSHKQASQNVSSWCQPPLALSPPLSDLSAKTFLAAQSPLSTMMPDSVSTAPEFMLAALSSPPIDSTSGLSHEQASRLVHLACQPPSALSRKRLALLTLLVDLPFANCCYFAYASLRFAAFVPPFKRTCNMYASTSCLVVRSCSSSTFAFFS
jgi:hypothetical protein